MTLCVYVCVCVCVSTNRLTYSVQKLFANILKCQQQLAKSIQSLISCAVRALLHFLLHTLLRFATFPPPHNQYGHQIRYRFMSGIHISFPFFVCVCFLLWFLHAAYEYGRLYPVHFLWHFLWALLLDCKLFFCASSLAFHTLPSGLNTIAYSFLVQIDQKAVHFSNILIGYASFLPTYLQSFSKYHAI